MMRLTTTEEDGSLTGAADDLRILRSSVGEANR